MRVGSLFSGYMGLDRAVERYFNAETVWTSEIDPGACKIIDHRFNGPNHGDLTQVDWSTVEPVDIVTGGFPCQDLSHAGKRLGLKPGTRSGLWSHMAYAISQLRPRYVIAENVRGLLSASAHSDLEPCPWCVGGAGDREPDLRALGAVLGDLAELGYDARWIGLRAADVGAPHGRFRVFVVATDTKGKPGGVGNGDDVRARSGAVGRQSATGRGSVADARSSGREWRRSDGLTGSRDPAAGCGGTTADAERGGRHGRSGELWQGRRPEPSHGGDVAPDTDHEGSHGGEPTGRRDVPHRGAVADPTSNGRDEGRPEPTRLVGRPHAAVSGDAAADTRSSGCEGRGRPQGRESNAGGNVRARTAGETSWGDYEPAIRRWERVLGRQAPPPTETGPKGGQRLSPRFVEWMMGLSPGWVTDVPDLSRNAQLKALGNGVVPQQTYEALRRAFAQEAAA